MRHENQGRGGKAIDVMRWLRRLPFRVVLFAVRRPWTTLGTAAVFAIVGTVIGALVLPTSTDQEKLFSQDVAFFRDFVTFQHQFPENDAACILIEPADASRIPPTERWTGLADAIVDRLRKMPTVVKSVHARVPSEKLGDQALLFEDSSQLPEYLASVRQLMPIVRMFGEPDDSSPPIRRFVDAMSLRRLTGNTAGGDDLPKFISAVAGSWERAIRDPSLPLTPGKGLPDLEKLGVESPRDLGYFYLPDESDPERKRRLLIIQAYPTEDYSSLTYVAEVVEAIRKVTREEAAKYPEFHAFVTGRPALEADEMRTADTDGFRAETVAMSVVFLGMLIFLRSLRLALSAVVSLLAGIAVTYFWTYLTVGELNLLSTVFLIALIGIGMDYFVQVLSRYRVESRRRASTRTAWIAVYHQVAAPIITACCGAAGAFLVSIFTHFKGAADLGVVAGGGLLLCLISGFTVLPAAVTVGGKKRDEETERRRDEVVRPSTTSSLRLSVSPSRPSPFTSSLRLSVSSSLLLPIVLLLGLAALLPFVTQSRFDPGLLELQAPNLESVQQIRKLQSWYAVVLSKDLATLRRARDAVAQSPEVKETESILSAHDNADWLSKNAGDLKQVSWSEPKAVAGADIMPFAASLKALSAQFAPKSSALAPSPGTPGEGWGGGGRGRVGVTESKRVAVAPRALDRGSQNVVADRATPTLHHFDTLRADPLPNPPPEYREREPLPSHSTGSPAQILQAVAEVLKSEADAGRADTVARRLSQWQQAFAGELRAQLGRFNPTGVRIADLPPELKGHLVADDGTCALYIYPKKDLWNRENLAAFVADVETRLGQTPGVPAPTGIAINLMHSTDRVQESFLWATWYALGLVVLLVVIDLRSLPHTLLAFSVLGLGLTALLGLMVLLGVSWNMANYFGLPILIGAGHEYGVFMVHRYREAKRKPLQRAWRGWDASDWGLLLCAYITSASFGFFWLIARHRGLKSLGLVMALGTACIYLATLLFLRPVLKWRLRES